VWLWGVVHLFLVHGRGGGRGRQVIGGVEDDKGGVELTDVEDAWEEAAGGGEGGHGGCEETVWGTPCEDWVHMTMT